LPVPVSISTVKSPEASVLDGARPLRSWMSFRLATISSSSSCRRFADAQVAFHAGQRHLPPEVLCHGEFRPAGFLAAKQAADRLDGRVLVIEVGLEVEFHGGEESRS